MNPHQPKPITFILSPPVTGEMLLRNLFELHVENLARILISKGVLEYCTSKPTDDIQAPLIALNPILVYGINKLEYIIEAALRLMAKNVNLPLTERYQSAHLRDTIDDDDDSKKIHFTFDGQRYVSQLWLHNNMWHFVVCFPDED